MPGDQPVLEEYDEEDASNEEETKKERKKVGDDHRAKINRFQG